MEEIKRTENFYKAFENVKKLVENFQKNEAHYLSGSYLEAEVRRDFIDNFFVILGWDVLHNIQKNPYEQEVKIELGVEINDRQKRPDYSFFTAPNFRDPVFLVEAKRPSSELLNKDFYFQTIRYAWHKSNPFAILTNFVHLHILDCRYMPDVSTAINKNFEIFHYLDYVNEDKFSEIYYLFSREAVGNNSIKKITQTLKKLKGKASNKLLFPVENQITIDDAYLKEIDEIRNRLAKAFYIKHPELTGEKLTEYTQLTIDRIVFIRFLEDKLIESKHYISELGEKGDIWEDFVALSREFDKKYNGIVFQKHTIDYKEFKGPDKGEFYSICQDMCHLNSRFLYNHIPVYILGSIYERFLGKIVRVEDKKIFVEEKEEVRKAGGVFYTPKYIVDYIVSQTVGKLIEGKTPAEIAKFRIADIACGSGSFLIGVFEYLLEYHTQYYQKNPKEAERDGCDKKDNKWKLSIEQKKQILVNNIFGVDIDPQAFYVTHLSIFLKLLEDETIGSVYEQHKVIREKILPDMKQNIQHGNSLIEFDFGSEMPIKERHDLLLEIHPLNWDRKFPTVMKEGGFDVIVGNPPYRTLLLGKRQEQVAQYMIDYYKNHYPNSSNYKINLFALFIERVTNLLKPNGLFSYIIPSTFYTAYYYKELRIYLFDKGSFINFCDLRFDVFDEPAIGGNAIFVYANNKENKTINLITATSEKEFLEPKIEQQVSEIFVSNPNHIIIFNKTYQQVLKKINKVKTIPLGEIAIIYQGIITGDNKKYIKNKSSSSKWQKILKGKNIVRYGLKFDNNYVFYSPKDLWSNTDINMYNVKEKIISRQTSDRIIASLDTEQYFTLDSTHTIHLITDKISLKYLLGILNSNLIKFLYQHTINEVGRLFAQVKVVNLKPLPIKTINPQNKKEKELHNQIVKLVEEMLNAVKILNEMNEGIEKDSYQNMVENTDKEINKLVYELYELTEEEIAIVEA